MRREKKAKQQECRVLSKRNCQLTEFPTIKLHVLQKVQEIDLSHNRIGDFTTLLPHGKTSPHALKHLRKVSLAFNKIPDVSFLVPLADAAQSLEEISVAGNPLTGTINFMFELVSLFPNLRSITNEKTVELCEEEKARTEDVHLHGGRVLNRFIERTSIREYSFSPKNKQQITQDLQDIIEALGEPRESTVDYNQLLFSSIEAVLSIKSDQLMIDPIKYPGGTVRPQIQMMTTYTIEDTPQRGVQASNSHQLTSPVHLYNFYLKEMIVAPSICSRVLQSLQVSQETNRLLQSGQLSSLDQAELFLQLEKKWSSQACQGRGGQMPHKPLSPLRSICTNDSTQRSKQPSSAKQKQFCFFGLEPEWTAETLKFVRHRLASFLKYVVEAEQVALPPPQVLYALPETHPWEENRQFLSPKAQVQGYPCFYDENMVSTNREMMMFGHPQVAKSMSPKTQNRFILQSCLRVFQQAIQRIVFRKVSTARRVKAADLQYLEGTVSHVSLRMQSCALRLIFEWSVFVLCVQLKTEKAKLARVFAAWKMVKERKAKLLLKFQKRKSKRQQSFLSVFLTQWRITARHITTAETVRHKLQQLKGSSAYEGLESSEAEKRRELRRSATCQRLGRKWNRSKYEKK